MEPIENKREPYTPNLEIDKRSQLEARQKSPFSFVKYIVLALVILAISFVAASLLSEDSTGSRDNLIQRAVEASDGLNPIYESSDAQLLAGFIRQQFEWDSGAPYINETALRGVAVHEIVDGLELPTYIYEDAHGGQITVYIISYRLLDERTDNLSIDDRVLKRVSDEYELVVAPSKEGTQAVMWREYSFLFLAVSSNDAPVLSKRINPKRSP